MWCCKGNGSRGAQNLRKMSSLTFLMIVQPSAERKMPMSWISYHSSDSMSYCSTLYVVCRIRGWDFRSSGLIKKMISLDFNWRLLGFRWPNSSLQVWWANPNGANSDEIFGKRVKLFSSYFLKLFDRLNEILICKAIIKGGVEFLLGRSWKKLFGLLT